MATVIPTLKIIGDNTVEFTYSGLTTTNNDGTPIGEQWADYADRSVQVFGTFGAGGNLVIEGSNSSIYNTLNDADTGTMSLTAAGFKQAENVPVLTRPRVAAGDGSTSLTCIITCRRQPRAH